MNDLLPVGDGRHRCGWCGSDPLYVRYHDEEWGRPLHDDRRLFEKMILEGFQAGLSWITILRKRQAFRSAFAGFDPAKLARFGPADIERLLGDAGIVRHRGKIASAINNAVRCIELVEREGSLATYLWRFAPERPGPAPTVMRIVPPSTPESTALSKDLRRRGWSFVGPTTMYAMMQATGIVNDHLAGCAWRSVK